MATEALTERPNEATVTSEPEPTITIDHHNENVAPAPAHLNGDAASVVTDELDNKHISEIVDDLVNSTEVSISGGSDNEASKSDAAKLKDGERGHGRTASGVKKPTAFKSTNINRKFLTTTAATPSAVPKVSDKAAASAGSTSTSVTTAQANKPRLIVKGGSGVVAKTAGANGGKPGAAPDGNAVWNKNRPVPPPEPKKYTDEELKDKFGVHIAERLDPEHLKGHNNWADEEEDGEDWTPEAITWGDGTKTTISHATHAEVQVPPSPKPFAQSLVQENGTLETQKSPAPSAPSPSVKPGVLASGRGLVLKGAPEKPTLVAKPPAPPTPVKSPWATLPKVDKLPPVGIDLQMQGQAGPRPGEKLLGSHPMTSHPPKEIAADDFSRNPWRDGPGAPSRELFNSQSGRYEPVTDRRGPLRSEPMHNKQPALLQRASQDQQGPAEPSAAFQTHRTSEQHVPYGRRRGSSNVSGGSGSFMHRPKPHDFHHPLDAPHGRPESRNDSYEAVSPVSVPSAPHPVVYPAAHPVVHPAVHHETQQLQPQQSPNITQAQPVIAAAGTDGKPPMSEQDFKEAQRQFMVRAREAARQRRLEEEAREEAAKRERIRLKLEALGPAPESNSAKKAAFKDQAALSQPREIASPPKAATASLDTEHLSNASNSDRKPSVSDDKKPAGHDGNDDKKPPRADDKVAPVEGESSRESSTALSSSSLGEKKVGARPNGIVAAMPQEAGEGSTMPPGGSHAHPWPNEPKQSERFQQPSWGSQAVVKNVWGAPNTNNRTLGNGTFGSDIVAGQSSRSGNNKPGPGPIAPPSSARPGQTPSTNVPNRGTSRQEPIGPPKQTSRQERMPPKDAQGPEVRDQRHNAWATAVMDGDAAFSNMLNTQYEERDRRLKAEGRTLRDAQPSIKDTWRPTRLDADGRRVEQALIRTQQGQPVDEQNRIVTKLPDTTPLTEAGKTLRNEAATSSKAPASNSVVQQGRGGSRFFPPRDIRQETDRAKSSPSPPPPDMAGHPAFDGDTTHPRVTFPGPRPVVRLPPCLEATSEPSQKAVPHGLAWGTQAVHQATCHAPPASLAPIGSQRPSSTQVQSGQETGWQARIDSLLGGPRKSHGLQRSVTNDVRSFSTTHDQMQFPDEAYSLRDLSIMSKGLAEECFEEQEMGSLPPIRLPNKVPELLWQPAPPPRYPLAKKLWAIVTSIDRFAPQDSNLVRIKFPGKTEPKTVSLPVPRTRSNPRKDGRGGRGGNNRHTFQSHRGGKGRDEQGDSNTAGTASAPRSGRGSSYRPRDNWVRNSSAPIQSSG